MDIKKQRKGILDTYRYLSLPIPLHAWTIFPTTMLLKEQPLLLQPKGTGFCCHPAGIQRNDTQLAAPVGLIAVNLFATHLVVFFHIVAFLFSDQFIKLRLLSFLAGRVQHQ